MGISSDDEVVGQSSDSELENETPQEKRLRIAKEYLSQVEAESMLIIYVCLDAVQ